MAASKSWEGKAGASLADKVVRRWHPALLWTNWGRKLAVIWKDSVQGEERRTSANSQVLRWKCDRGVQGTSKVASVAGAR